ncbi:MAG: leucyl aminopeptidase [Acidobacteria bacterium]|nr:leucyl aminopeptidase [Acidobacteriota bacterium]
MELRIAQTAVHAVAVDALIIPAGEGEPPVLGRECDGLIAQIYSSREFKGSSGDLAWIHRPAGLAAERLLLAGTGKPGKLDAAELRRCGGAAVRHAKSKCAHTVALALPAALSNAAGVQAAFEGAILSDYETDQRKTDPDRAEKYLTRFELVVAQAVEGGESAMERGRITAESQNFTRSLVNEPSNILNPAELAARARAMASDVGLECEVLDEDRMRQLGMGSLLAVAMGSDNPPALIILRYRPEAAGPEGVHLGLLGKGVTFDCGGLSIKPADGMEKMKYDMAGAAAVIGAMRAIALLRPAIPVTALAPAVENMINGRAQRPGDIVTTLSGKTVEVLNTDAEGRLILNDAITYAQRLGCTHLVDAATLTGAIAVALGGVNAGLFTNNEELAGRVLASAKRQGERLWQMPMDDEYKELLKSAFADLPNIGTRYGGSISAAYFLKEFADPAPWVHLDIAGTAWIDEAKPHMAKGPTGICVRTFVDLAMSWT